MSGRTAFRGYARRAYREQRYAARADNVRTIAPDLESAKTGLAAVVLA